MSYLVKFPGDFGHLSFDHRGEIVEWLRTEWSLMQDLYNADTGGGVENATQQMKQLFETTQTQLNSGGWDPSHEDLKDLATAVANTTFPACSDEGKLIRRAIKLHGPGAGVRTWQYLKGDRSPPRGLDQTAIGYIFAASFSADQARRVPSYRIAEHFNRLEERAKGFQEELKERAQASREIVESNGKEAQAEIRRVRQRLEAFQSAFKSGLAMEAPSKYWKTKQSKHTRHAKQAVAGVIIYLAGLFTVAILFGMDLLRAMNGVAPDATSFEPKLWSLGVAAALLALLLWPVRLLAKLVATNIHLATDANERRVMTMCLLALLRRDKAFDNELPIMLAPLFRSSADAFVKDDGTPNLLVLEALQSLRNKVGS